MHIYHEEMQLSSRYGVIVMLNYAHQRTLQFALSESFLKAHTGILGKKKKGSSARIKRALADFPTKASPWSHIYPLFRNIPGSVFIQLFSRSSQLAQENQRKVANVPPRPTSLVIPSGGGGGGNVQRHGLLLRLGP